MQIRAPCDSMVVISISGPHVLVIVLDYAMIPGLANKALQPYRCRSSTWPSCLTSCSMGKSTSSVCELAQLTTGLLANNIISLKR